MRDHYTSCHGIVKRLSIAYGVARAFLPANPAMRSGEGFASHFSGSRLGSGGQQTNQGPLLYATSDNRYYVNYANPPVQQGPRPRLRG